MKLETVQPKQWKQIKKIYMEAFPKAEQKPFFLLKKSKKVKIYTAVECDKVLGFAATIQLQNLVMVDYLAVDSQARSNGIGSFLLHEICRTFQDKKVVLLIEQPDASAENQSQRVARRRFYLKNGFTSSQLLVKGVSGTMEILNFGGKISPEQYMELQEYALGRFLFKLSKIKLVTEERSISMKKVIYRTIEKKDYPQVRNLICTSFGLDSYVSDAKTLDIIKKRYLCSCLAEQTYNQVAEVDGQVVGVIMGASSHDKHDAFNMVQAIHSLCCTLQLVLFHRKACSGQGNIHKAYGELIQGRKKQYDGVLTLFIVQKKMRGLGIGKELLKSVQAYWKLNGTRCSYLYTDDTCNYGFYEHMGLTRTAETRVSVLRNGKKDNLNVYLYEYKGEAVL